MRPDSFDIQGHRGARGLYPENTIPGFLRAIELGVTTLEMDVVVSKDHRIVVSHDPWFARSICRRPDGRRIPFARQRTFRLYDMRYEEIAAYDCGSLRHPHFRRQQSVPAPKPLLTAVIDAAEARTAADGHMPVFYSIETKSRREWEGLYHPDPDTFARLLVDVIEEKQIVERAVVQSFDVRTLQRARSMNPGIRLSLLVDRRPAPAVDRNLERLGFVPAIYSPHRDVVDAALIGRAHHHGMDVIPWTVNQADDMQALRALGVDGLITDYPDVAVRLFRK